MLQAQAKVEADGAQEREFQVQAELYANNKDEKKILAQQKKEAAVNKDKADGMYEANQQQHCQLRK